MIKSILVVCTGNICRSPLGERALASLLPDIDVHSAGIAAVVGEGADHETDIVASEAGISLAGHISRQITEEMIREADLILVMEALHRSRIEALLPSASGKIMLFDHWTGAKGIADPFGKTTDFHRAIRDEINRAAKAWAEKFVRNTT